MKRDEVTNESQKQCKWVNESKDGTSFCVDDFLPVKEKSKLRSSSSCRETPKPFVEIVKKFKF